MPQQQRTKSATEAQREATQSGRGRVARATAGSVVQSVAQPAQFSRPAGGCGEEQSEPGRGRGHDRLPDRRSRLPAAVRGAEDPVRLPLEKFCRVRDGYFKRLRGRRFRAFGPAVRVRGPDSRAQGSKRQVFQTREESGTVEGVEGREPKIGIRFRARERGCDGGGRGTGGGHRLRRVVARRYAVQLQGFPVPEEGGEVWAEAGGEEQQIGYRREADVGGRNFWNRAQGLQMDES